MSLSFLCFNYMLCSKFSKFERISLGVIHFFGLSGRYLYCWGGRGRLRLAKVTVAFFGLFSWTFLIWKKKLWKNSGGEITGNDFIAHLVRVTKVSGSFSQTGNRWSWTKTGLLLGVNPEVRNFRLSRTSDHFLCETGLWIIQVSPEREPDEKSRNIKLPLSASYKGSLETIDGQLTTFPHVWLSRLSDSNVELAKGKASQVEVIAKPRHEQQNFYRGLWSCASSQSLCNREYLTVQQQSALQCLWSLGAVRCVFLVQSHTCH